LASARGASAETPVLALSAQHDVHDTAALGDLQPAFAHPDPSRQSVSFDITLAAGTVIDNIASAHHAIDVTAAEDAYRVKLKGESVAPDRDFELAWTPVVLGGPAATLFRERTAAGEHVLLMFMPPQDRTPVAAPREVIFIIDTSGSMAGESIEQARASLLKGLATLVPADRFNIIQFNSVFETMFAAPLDASADNIERARGYVRSLTADGGTEMMPALQTAFAMPRSREHLRQIVFITDGAVSNEVELMRAIHAGIGDGRLFIVGIGSAPNGYFMRTAAQTGRGTFTFIGAGHDVERKMGELMQKLTRPVLANIQLQWPNGVVPEYAPAQVADLYADEPLVISARLGDRPRGVLTISGRAGAAWTRQFSLDDVGSSPGVATLWARNRIADLMSLQTQRVSDAEIRAQVLPLALEYQLVSKYTSLVAIDKTPVRRPDEALQRARIENTKPHGSQWQASGLPKTATPAQLQLLIGSMALLLALGIWARSTQRFAGRS
jgi:Ca-activated chloride channel family protein